MMKFDKMFLVLIIVVFGFSCQLVLLALLFFSLPIDYQLEKFPYLLDWAFLYRFVCLVSLVVSCVIVAHNPFNTKKEANDKTRNDNVVSARKVGGGGGTKLISLLPVPLRNLALPIMTFIGILPLFFVAGSLTMLTELGAHGIILALICWLLGGLSISKLARIWAGVWSKMLYFRNGYQVVYGICISVIVAGLCCLTLMREWLHENSLQLALLLILLLVSSIACSKIANLYTADIETIKSRHFLKMLNKQMTFIARAIKPFFAGLALAVAYYLYLSNYGALGSFTVISICVASGGLIYALANAATKHMMLVSNSDKLTHSLICIGFLFLMISPQEFRPFFLAIILFACTFFLIQYWCTMTQLLASWQINPDHYFAHQYITVVAGMIAGGILGIVTQYFSTSQAGQIELLGAGIIIAFVLCQVLSSYDNTLWNDLNDFLNGVNKLPLKEEVHAPHDSGKYKEKCLYLAQQHNLTKREVEVFFLLAKGRNAVVIANKLVISEYTSKTHIYHVYRKFGLKSQQELIDYVESYSFEEY